MTNEQVAKRLVNVCFTFREERMDDRVAVIGIVVEKDGDVNKINELLHEFREYVVGRMGLPYPKRGVSLISVVVDGPADKISALSGKLGMIDGVTAKAAYSKVS